MISKQRTKSTTPEVSERSVTAREAIREVIVAKKVYKHTRMSEL